MRELSSDSDQVGLSRMLLNTGRSYVNRADHFMERIGLYRGQAILLLILSEQNGLTHSELAKKLGISMAATTKVIKRLEALNYLQRQADPSDKRNSRIFLRAEGWGGHPPDSGCIYWGVEVITSVPLKVIVLFERYAGGTL